MWREREMKCLMIWAHVGRVAPHWVLWRMLNRLSYSTAAKPYTIIEAVWAIVSKSLPAAWCTSPSSCWCRGRTPAAPLHPSSASRRPWLDTLRLPGGSRSTGSSRSGPLPGVTGRTSARSRSSSNGRRCPGWTGRSARTRTGLKKRSKVWIRQLGNFNWSFPTCPVTLFLAILLW